jgi:hypothetical protein
MLVDFSPMQDFPMAFQALHDCPIICFALAISLVECLLKANLVEV